jgi:hypothetical protein
MLGTAKVALLIKENISAYETPRPHASSVSSSHGQLWSSPRLNPAPGRSGSMDAAGLENLPAMAGALPRHRADSASSVISQSRQSGSDAGPPITGDVYVAPKPNYAISPSGKIPDGYVAHARDACTAIDYQWDTMNQWGDGGNPNEEWVAMHRRFRAGFQKLIDWYSTNENPTALVTKTISPAHEAEHSLADDEELEDVVVIVSHGAGCNAMIGAITRQPVLMDVGVATLTMAVRKNDDPIPLEGSTTTPGGGRVPIDQYYDLKIQASNDHLRNTNPASSLGRSMSTSSGTSYIAGSAQPRGRVATISSYGATSGGKLGLPDLDLGGSRSNSATANLVSMRKTSNSNTAPGKPWTPPLNTGGGTFAGNAGLGLYQAPASTGLWTPLSATSRSAFEVKSPEQEDDDDFPDFDGVRRFGTATVSAAAPESTPRTQPDPRSIKSPARLQEISRPASRDGEQHKTEVPARANAAGGLWGA